MGRFSGLERILTKAATPDGHQFAEAPIVSSPIELWRRGDVFCCVLHHPDARTYEVHVVHCASVIVRRCFRHPDEAALLAAEYLREFGADLGGF